MGSRKGEEASNHELLEAQAHVLNHIHMFINSMSLRCAVQLRIPDIIHSHGQPMTLPDLVAALPIHPTKAHFVPRLMRMLSHSGYFTEPTLGHDQRGYALTLSSRLLLRDNPFSLSPYVLSTLDPIMVKPHQHMSTWFRNDDPTSFWTAHGTPVWDLFGNQEPELGRLFSESMAGDARLVVNVLVDEYKEVFEGVNTLVDVGGGTGSMAMGIANAFPHLDCTVLDLPHVVDGFKGTKNLKFLGGDMFHTIPPANAILLKFILHDWSDKECVKILEKCKEAIMSSGDNGGKVILVEMVLDDLISHVEAMETKLLFDMEMMVLTSGRERNEKEWGELFSTAGFSDYRITHKLCLRSIIEVYP